MAQVELAVDQDWPLPLQQRAMEYLYERWPAVEWKRLTLPWSHRDAREGPVLALLGLTATAPPADPSDLAVIRRNWGTVDDPVAAFDRLRPSIDFQVARLLTPKDGADPLRRLEILPGQLTRRALLSLPHPVGLPLPALPRVNAALCQGAKGCGQCRQVCAADALSISGNAIHIEANRCQTCGACVAACPTGALESAHVSDAQWLAGLATMKTLPGPQRRTQIHCEHPQSPEPRDPVSLTVSCVAEIGWHHLFTGLAALESPVDVICPDHSCEHYAAAALALDKAARIGDAWSASSEVRDSDDDPSRVAGRWTRLMNSVARCAPGMDPDTWNSLPDAPLGWHVSLDTRHSMCTLCGGCAHVCPTEAFALQWDGNQARLSFDAARCLGCGACIPSCPEAVLTLHRESALPLPSTTILYEDDRVRCRGCGGVLETSAFLEGLALRLTSLGFSGPMLESIYYCADCKGRQVHNESDRVSVKP